MRTDRVLRAGVLAAVAATAGLGSAGCSHLDNTEKGALAGAGIGTGVGLGVGALTGAPRLGAAVGGLLGAGTGAAIGNEQDRRDDRARDAAHAQAAAAAQAQAQQQRLGITDVVRLAQAGHDDEVIVNQIRTTGSTFPALTASDLNFLKDNGVSGRVIAEMQNSRAVGPPARVVVRDPPPAVIVHEPPPPPVYVVPRPYYYHPRPVVYAGGFYRIR